MVYLPPNYYLAIKHGIMEFEGQWMEAETIILNEDNLDTARQIAHFISFV